MPPMVEEESSRSQHLKEHTRPLTSPELLIGGLGIHCLVLFTNGWPFHGSNTDVCVFHVWSHKPTPLLSPQ